MKTMSLNQMGEINGSFDYSQENMLAFSGGVIIAMSFGGPFGFLGGLYVSSAIMMWKCPGTKHR